MSGYAADLIEHIQRTWGRTGILRDLTQGRRAALPPEWRVLELPAFNRREYWMYGTVGMSGPGDADAVELYMLAPAPDPGLLEILAAVSDFHRTGERLGWGHSVNFGRPWLENSRCTFGLLSLPYLFGPEFEAFRSGDASARILWLLPITPEERDYKIAHGLEALELLFESAPFDYLDPDRPSVVTREGPAAEL